MAKGRESSGGCGKTYHAIVALLLMIAGGGLVGFGIYRKTKTNDGPFSLDYEAGEVTELDNIWSWVLRFNTAAIVVGAFLLVAGIAALIALTRRCIGGVFKVAYILVALVIMLALVGISGVAWYLLAKRNDSELSDFVAKAWESTVKSKPEDICSIEKDFQCRGFNDKDCEKCPLGVGTSCTPELLLRCAPCSEGETSNVANGCWNEFQSRFRRFYIIAGVVGAVLAGVMLSDMCVLCSL